MKHIERRPDVSAEIHLPAAERSGSSGGAFIRFHGPAVPFSLIRSAWLFAVLTLLAGCAGKKTGPPPAVPVIVGKTLVQPEPISLNVVGTVEPIESAAVKAQVGGLVVRVDFVEGQDVRAGQLLIQIDPRPFQAALNAATAQLARDSSQAANAEIQAARYSGLVQKDYVTKEQFDAVRTQAEAMKSTVRVDEAVVEQARLNLGWASITAPISGRTGSLLVKKGNVIRADDLPLVIINQIRPIRVSFAAPENQLSLVRRYSAGKTLEVHVKTSRTTGSPEVKGRLGFIDNEVDASTGTFTLKAVFPNDDSSLWPGQFVDVELILAVEHNAMTVPSSAVVTGQDGTFVFVVGSDKKAEKRPVKVNRTLDAVTVVDEGLKAGETVVTDGQMRLMPGAAVEFKPGAVKPGTRRAP
jgi:multidrug efflux system membrane fusion protein